MNTTVSPVRRTILGRLARPGFWLVVLGLVGGTGWLVWEDRPTASLRTIQEWASHGGTVAAERELRRRLRQSPHDGAARMQLARLFAARDDYLSCARELHQVPAWWPARADALFLEGQAWKYVNRARDAEAASEALIADDPLHPVAPRYFSGAARELIARYVLENRLDDARRVLWRAYDAAAPQERRDVLLMRARAELERVAHEEAVVALRLNAAADPTDWSSRRALAVEEQVASRPDEADRQIEAVLKALPDDPRAWRARLEIAHLRGDRDAVQAALARLPKSAEADPDVCKFRGLAHTWKGDFRAAADSFRKAVALNPREAEYPYQLGMAEQRLGLRDQAATDLLQSRRLRDDYQKMHEAYIHYQSVARPDVDPAAPAVRAAVERLADLSERLGWTREAEAWRKTL